jgi:hypothetical protein
MRTSSYHPTQTSGREFVPPIPRASKGRIMRRSVRRFFGGIGAALRIIFSGRPLLVVCLLLLLPFTGWLLSDRLFAPASSTSSGAQVGARLPEPPVAQQYVTAVQKGDADAVWNTFSATEKAQRIARGEDKTMLSRVLQLEQQAKMTYTAFHYVGSYPEPSGSVAAYYFYVGDTGSGQQTRNLPLLFAVDAHGMIVEVSDSLYDAALAQLKGGP